MSRASRWKVLALAGAVSLGLAGTAVAGPKGGGHGWGPGWGGPGWMPPGQAKKRGYGWMPPGHAKRMYRSRSARYYTPAYNRYGPRGVSWGR